MVIHAASLIIHFV